MFYKSIQQPSIFRPNKQAAQILQQKLQTDPHNQFSEHDKEFCRKAVHPSKLPTRLPKASTACGWWFVPDLNVPSIGTLGRRDKPLFPETLPSGGEWIWSIKEAIMKEDIKRCSTIRNCDLIDMKGLKGECGFCPNLGRAVPAKPNGTERYPDVASCGTDLVMTKDKCPKPEKEPIVTPEGISCGTYGRPSLDYKLRLYSKEECSALDPNAAFGANGECLKPGGTGSYSVDCSGLNGPMDEKGVCDPDDKGRLTRPCLLSLAKGMGYTAGGTIMRLLTTSTEVKNEMDIISIRVLESIGISVPDAILGDGDIDLDSAKNIYHRLIDISNGGTAELYREAAKHLVYGTNNFDPCNIPDNVRGPFMKECIQREFRKAGCQPAGSSYPSSDIQVGKFNGYSWANVRDEFRDLYASMSSEDGDIQDASVEKCLGIGVKRAQPEPCPSDYIFYGHWVQRDVIVKLIRKLPNGERVYIIKDGPFTKMVSETGIARYYVGEMSAFNPYSWNFYYDAFTYYQVRKK